MNMRLFTLVIHMCLLSTVSCFIPFPSGGIYLLGFGVVGALYSIYIYIFRFRSYLVTDIGRTLVAKGELVNFHEAYLMCWANALVNKMPRDCVCVCVCPGLWLRGFKL